MSFKSHNIIDETATETTTSIISFPAEYRKAFQVVWTGTVAATVVIQSSIDSETWESPVGTVSPAGSAGSSLVEISSAAPFYRVVVSGVSGAGNLKVVAHGIG